MKKFLKTWIDTSYRIFSEFNIFVQCLFTTKVVPKLVLIFSEWACNTIYWNSDEAYVFCSAAITRDLFDKQTSTGATFKDNELQSTSTSSEFRQMALQAHPERVRTSFGTTLVFTKTISTFLQKFLNIYSSFFQNFQTILFKILWKCYSKGFVKFNMKFCHFNVKLNLNFSIFSKISQKFFF